MKANELRIGNIIEQGTITMLELTTDEIVCVKCDGKVIGNHTYIPLTEDWLLKFGFEKTYSSEFRTKLDHITLNELGFDFSHTPDKSMEGFRYYGHYIKIDYVHQLQNLYFALTGEELKTVQP